MTTNFQGDLNVEMHFKLQIIGKSWWTKNILIALQALN